MEDLFQIIFILIFILSSIASSLNKKKKRKQQQAKKAEPVSVKKTETAGSKKKDQKSTSQILEEMLGMKIELPEPQKTEAPPVYSEDSFESSTWDPTEEFEEKLDDGKSDYQEKMVNKKSEFLDARNKHRAFKKEEKVEVKDILEAAGVTKLFAKEANLKDYIKVQEILNKPKALRR